MQCKSGGENMATRRYKEYKPLQKTKYKNLKWKHNKSECVTNKPPKKICKQHLYIVQESNYKTLRLHNERELGAIIDGSWIEDI
jgi:hypothetical protein